MHIHRSLSMALAAATGVLTTSFLTHKSFDGQRESPPELRRLLEVIEFVEIDDGFGNALETLRIEGVNVQIRTRASARSTEATTSRYYVLGTLGGSSHSVVNGGGALVGGFENHIDPSGIATIVGGRGNGAEAQVRHATLVGGEGNRAGGDYSVVGGGRSRTAAGEHDWVAGSLFEDE